VLCCVLCAVLWHSIFIYLSTDFSGVTQYNIIQCIITLPYYLLDPILGQAVHKEISLVNTFKPTLQSKLLKAKSPKDSRADVLRFADLLTKCLVLDPSRRTSVQAALKHDFFRLQKK